MVFDSSILRRVPLLYHRFCQSTFISIGLHDFASSLKGFRLYSTVSCSRVDFAVDCSQVDFMVVPLDLWVDRFLDFALSLASFCSLVCSFYGFRLSALFSALILFCLMFLYISWCLSLIASSIESFTFFMLRFVFDIILKRNLFHLIHT